MKLYDVEMAMCFTKNLRVMAPDEETAEKIAELIFKGTNALTLGLSNLEDFEALAVPVLDASDYDGDDDERCDLDLAEEEELPFDKQLSPPDADRAFQDLLARMLGMIDDHKIHIHIVP